jgi:hypothetical protein
MVKIIVLSEYSTHPPEQLGLGRLKIDGGPLYDLARVQKLVVNPDYITLTTRACQKDVHKLFDSDLGSVAELIQALHLVDYRDSEWCENGSTGVMACDAYQIRRSEQRPLQTKPIAVEYFLKFAVGKTGQLLLLVSCHLSK